MRALAITLYLLATPALADLPGTASVINGDTIEVQGIDAGMSVPGSKADVPATWPGSPLLAEGVEKVL